MLSIAYSTYILSNQIHFPLLQLHNHDDNSPLTTPLKLLSLIHKLYSLLLFLLFIIHLCRC